MDNIQQNINIKDERNYGVDLLRVISMIFVVMVHCTGRGGLIKGTLEDSVQCKFAFFIDIFASVAVNIFALISGYVSYRNKEKKVNYSNYLNIWFQVVFYGLAVTWVFNIFNPSVVTKSDYINSCFPVSNKLYWYFTAYTGLYAIMPLLNKAIRNCSQETLKKIFIAIIVFFSIWDRISNLFVLSNGYSFVWITLIYILGAIIKKCEIGKNMKNYQIIIGISAMYVITYLYRFYGLELSLDYITIDKGLLIPYTSPTILGVAILYLIGFSKIKFNNTLKKIVGFFASSAFSIYLLNNHKLVWDYIMNDLFVNIGTQSIIKIAVYIIGFSLLFAVGSILIDKIRILIFKLFKIKVLSDKIVNLLDKIVTKISSLI